MGRWDSKELPGAQFAQRFDVIEMLGERANTRARAHALTHSRDTSAQADCVHPPLVLTHVNMHTAYVYSQLQQQTLEFNITSCITSFCFSSV